MKTTHFLRRLVPVLLFFQAGASMAAPPVNDDYSDFITLSGINATASGTTVEATAEGGDELDYRGQTGTGPSVWYSWIAPTGITAARVTVNFATDPGECIVSLPASSRFPIGGMAQYLPDVIESGQRSFLFRTTPGADYQIRIAGRNGSTTGTAFTLTINGLTTLNAPANDNRTSATVLPSLGTVTATGTFQDASSRDDELYFSAPFSDPSSELVMQPAAVWYRWTAPSSGHYCHQVIGQKYLRTTVFQVTGSDDRLADFEDNRSPNGFFASSGEQFYIKVGSDVGGGYFSGNFQLILAAERSRNFINQFSGPPGPDPRGFLEYQLIGASANPNDPSYAPGVTNVWCPLVPLPLNNFLTPGIWEVGGYDPAVLRVTVFRENSFEDIPAVATSDRSPTLRFVVPPGEVTGYSAEVALAHPENAASLAALQGTLTLREVPAASAPANDQFANAITLNSQPLTFQIGTTTGASGEVSEDFSEIGEAVTRDIPHSTVWYRWTSLASATHWMVALDDENKPLHLRITSGDLGSFSNLGNDVTLREAGVEVTAGQTYNIAVDDDGASATGRFRLFIGRNLSFDNFASRPQLTSNSNGIAEWRYASSYGMTREAGEPDTNNLGHTAWFEYRADSTAPVYINTFGSNYDTVVHVYTGFTLATLAQVASNDDFDSSLNRASALSFTPVTGTFYQIRVSGYIAAKGIFYLRVGRQPSSWTPYQIWSMNHEWPSPDNLPLSDPDKDGLSNLQECVFGGNPLVPENRRTVGQSFPPQAFAPPAYGLTYQIATPYLTGQGIGSPITVTPQSSSTLATWTNLTPTVSGSAFTATVPAPAGPGGKVFLRTKVVSP